LLWKYPAVEASILEQFQPEQHCSYSTYLQGPALQSQVWSLELMQSHPSAELAPAGRDAVALLVLARLFAEATRL
jgi:hypothetical protein